MSASLYLNHISYPDSYTYFETKSGLICYSYGPAARFDGEHIVCAVVGYFSDKPTSRLQVNTGRYIEKFVYEGNEYIGDVVEQLVQAPFEVRERIKRLVRVNPETGERLLVMPCFEILKTYSPHAALEHLMDGTSGLGAQKETAVRKLIDIFGQFDIKQEDLGMYGSLVYGAAIESPTKVSDIDILVYGLYNRLKIDKMIAVYGNKDKTNSKYSAINEFFPWRIARERRNDISQMRFDENIIVDIKTVRKTEDKVSFDFQNYEVEQGELEIEGIVIDDVEGLTSPSVYKIKSTGKIYIVGTRLYVFVGAAKKGDRVKIKGKKLKGKDMILVADARAHYIYQSQQF